MIHLFFRYRIIFCSVCILSNRHMNVRSAWHIFLAQKSSGNKFVYGGCQFNMIFTLTVSNALIILIYSTFHSTFQMFCLSTTGLYTCSLTYRFHCLYVWVDGAPRIVGQIYCWLTTTVVKEESKFHNDTDSSHISN